MKNKPEAKRAVGMAQMVQSLSSNLEALSSDPSTASQSINKPINNSAQCLYGLRAALTGGTFLEHGAKLYLIAYAGTPNACVNVGLILLCVT
jgi:hypothetical protein